MGLTGRRPVDHGQDGGASMAGDTKAYNPLDRPNLAASVAKALLERPARPLAEIVSRPFMGAGIYVLYYSGPFEAYAPIAARNADGRFDAPIYIGKAVPSGSRKGAGLAPPTGGTALHGRLREHAETIAQAATTLRLDDFHCRHLVVEDIWIPLGETLLIQTYAPVWNQIVEGFGNHDPGAGRHAGKRPRWDVVHPGRAWALKCAERKEGVEEILAKVAAHLATSDPSRRPA